MRTSPHDQAGFDARFAAMTDGDRVHTASPEDLPRYADLTDEDFTSGGLTGTDAAKLRRFDELGDRWSRGELSLERFADEMEHGEQAD